jgi:hypothetical protein
LNKKGAQKQKTKNTKQRLLAGRCFIFKQLITNIELRSASFYKPFSSPFLTHQTKNNQPLELVILRGGAAGYRTPVRAVIIYPSTSVVRLKTWHTSNAQSVNQGW